MNLHIKIVQFVTIYASSVILLITTQAIPEIYKYNSTDELSISTFPCGLIKGIFENNSDGNFVRAFYGVPYTTAKRWKPPTQLKINETCWNGTFEADDPGPACYQHKGNGKYSENCLHLHVWAPRNGNSTKSSSLKEPYQQQLLPVAFYLHGGSLVEGSAVGAQAAFGRENNIVNSMKVVSVACNYRLGVLGFLSLKTLSANDPRGISGNYGLLDIIEALHWVQMNIKSFGGDPTKVTIYGQSSGGTLVLALMASPFANGLFVGAVSMSGSPRLNSTLKEAETYWHLEVLNNLPQCSNKDQQTSKYDNGTLYDCLMNLKPEMLVQAQPYDWDPKNGWGTNIFLKSYRYAPLLLIDGKTIPRSFSETWSGKFKVPNDVPLIVGATAQEIDFSPGNDTRNFTKQQFSQFMVNAIDQGGFPNIFTKRLLDVYGLMEENNDDNQLFISSSFANQSLLKKLPWYPQKLFATIISDATEICSTRQLLLKLSQSLKSNVYGYIVTQKTAKPFCALSKFQIVKGYCSLYSFHAIDMFALFGWINPYYNASGKDLTFTTLLRRRFQEFFYTGNIHRWNTFLTKNDVDSLSYQFNMLHTPIENIEGGYKLNACNLFDQYGFNKNKSWVN